jgi:Carboxypeptidase regulatory-like domain/TonB-dependent Receptor Plug Domain
VKRTAFIVFVGWLMLSVAPKVFAQGVGSVRGTVTDEKGAVVSGADVAITNVATAYSRAVVSDVNGNYSFQSIPIGQYVLKVKKGGFKDFQENDITLHVNDVLTLDTQLRVGGTTETVEVTASTTQVELANADLTSTINGQQATELPLNGNNFAQLVTLVPGVAVENGFSYDKKGQQGGADISISGGAQNGNLWLVDGTNIVDVGSNRTINIYPSLDSIDEFKVERNSYSAKFGGAGGGIITLVTKSGTNAFHGDTWYSGRNDLLDAWDPVLKNSKLTSKNPSSVTKNTIRLNNFGFSVGGPIKKDKAFFFVSEEWDRLRTQTIVSTNVPTPLERQGDFSDQALDATFSSPGKTVGCLGTLTGLTDPDPTNAGGAFTASARTPGIIDVIPAGRQSTAGPKILNFFLQPTLAPGSPGYGCGNNFVKALPQPTNYREDNYRGDVNLTSTLSLMMKYTGDSWLYGPSAKGQTGWGADTGASPIAEKWSSPGRIAVARLTKLLGSSAVNSFQFSYSMNRIDISPVNPQAVTTLNSIVPVNFTTSKTSDPAIQISGGGLPHILSFAPWLNGEDLYTWQDDFSKVIGKHTLAIGASISKNAKFQPNFSNIRGTLNGPNSYEGCKTVGAGAAAGCTAFPTNTTGDGIANWILLNESFGYSEQNVVFNKQGRWQNYEFYVNDDYKLSNRLTVNLGLRYSYLPWPYQVNDQFSVFNPAAFNPTLAKTAQGTCNGLLYSASLSSNPCTALGLLGGVKGPNRAIQNQFYHGFAPRVGVAWDPTGSQKWAIRAGFGQFYNRDDIYLTDGTAGTNPPFVSTFKDNGSGRFLDNLNALPGCGGTLNACFTSGFGTPNLGQTTSNRSPYVYQFNLSVQRELWKDTKLEVGYVGNRTRDWTSKYDVNGIFPGNRLLYAQTGNNNLRPFGAVTITTGGIPTTTPFITGGIPFFDHHGNAEYDSVQSAFSSHLTHNSFVQATYTFGRSFSVMPLNTTNGGGGLVPDPYNFRNGYGLSNINRPSIFSANFVYNLPALQNMEKFVRNSLGSWEVGSIVNLTSGSSYTPGVGIGHLGGDLAGVGQGGAPRPNLVPGQPCENPGFKSFKNGEKFDWINPNRYTLNGLQLGTFGNAPVGDCLGPPTRTVDFSLSKNFSITERVKAQFRMDFFNLFNHPNFGNPGATINFSAPNTAALPEFKDANGNSTTNVLQAVSIQNTSPNPNQGAVGTVGDRNRELQYSLKFTF